MKKVILVNISSLYISNDSCQPVTLTDNEKLLSSIFKDKYSFVEIYTPIATFTAKTYKAIQTLIEDFSTKNKIFDFHAIIVKH